MSRCPESQQYSNFTDCFECELTQYFNMETKQCDTCNGTLNLTSKLCIPKQTMLTYLDPNNQSKLILAENKTLADYE